MQVCANFIELYGIFVLDFKGNLDLNNDYYQTLDKNFKEALNLIDKELSHNELIEFLKSGNIPQKQLGALRLNKLENSDEAEILLNNLVGQDGKIRETVSMKIKELLNNETYKSYFNSIDINVLSDYFLAAIIDINGNICRNVLDSLGYFKQNSDFLNMFIPKLINLINDLTDKINNFDVKDGKYKVNKELFKLYWCLEAVNILYDKFSVHDLKKIIIQTKDIEEYTIREKVAKILLNETDDNELILIREELKSDTNYYVRRVLS